MILVDHIEEQDLFEPNLLMRRHPAHGAVVETLEHDGTAPARLGFFDPQLHVERITLGVTPGPVFFRRRSDSKGVHQFVHVLPGQRAHGDAALQAWPQVLIPRRVCGFQLVATQDDYGGLKGRRL